MFSFGDVLVSVLALVCMGLPYVVFQRGLSIGPANLTLDQFFCNILFDMTSAS